MVLPGRGMEERAISLLGGIMPGISRTPGRHLWRTLQTPLMSTSPTTMLWATGAAAARPMTGAKCHASHFGTILAYYAYYTPKHILPHREILKVLKLVPTAISWFWVQK